MKIVVTVLLIVAITRASTPSPKEQFEKFKHDYNRTYGCPEEEKVRFLIFTDLLKKIEIQNKKFKDGNSSFTIGIDQFADYVYSEVPTGLITPGSEPPPIKEFTQFKKDYNRTYACKGLEELRYHIFEMNFMTIEEHNKNNSTFKLKINKFTDMLPEEVPKGLNKTT